MQQYVAWTDFVHVPAVLILYSLYLCLKRLVFIRIANSLHVYMYAQDQFKISLFNYFSLLETIDKWVFFLKEHLIEWTYILITQLPFFLFQFLTF